ncbi:MAG: Rpn family recombination-promoting nuclease/putative transposase [Anaerolineae bacterium]
MTQRADIGSRRLISLAPTAWVRWLLDDDTLDAIDLLSADFQWVSRESDALIRVHSPTYGDFVVVNEIQLHHDPRMPSRMRAYAGLAHERYGEPIYPVLVNILPPPAGVDIPTRFESEFLGLVARQDYRVVNLWEVEAQWVLDLELLPLLPFVPVLRGGQDLSLLKRAVTRLRAEPALSELEPLLAFFASFVLETEFVRQIMRWDMAILRESPWYQEILEEGREQGRREDVLQILEYRFGEVPAEIEDALGGADLEQLERLFGVALRTTTLDEFRAHLPPASAGADGTISSPSSGA